MISVICYIVKISILFLTFDDLVSFFYHLYLFFFLFTAALKMYSNWDKYLMTHNLLSTIQWGQLQLQVRVKMLQ